MLNLHTLKFSNLILSIIQEYNKLLMKIWILNLENNFQMIILEQTLYFVDEELISRRVKWKGTYFKL